MDDAPKKIDFDIIRNSGAGKTAFVCGLGPSLSPYLERFEQMSLDKDKYVFICCNEFDLMTKINADYWVISNSILTIDKTHSRFNKNPDTTLVYADSVDMTPRNIVDNLLTIKHYLPYDQRHFDNKNCPIEYCCKHRIDGRLTIQEYLMSISGTNKRYSTAHTVASHSLALAIILGCNPIYLCGIELDYRLGYVNGSIERDFAAFDRYIEEMITDFKIAKESADNLGIDIFNLSKMSKLKSIYETKENLNF